MITLKFRFAAIALLFVGCATHEQMPPSRSEETCTTPVCQIRITVTSAGFIDVKPEILRVKGNNHVMIHWVLQTGTYKFDNDGIKFYDPRHPSEFSDGQPTNNGQQFQWKDKNSAKNEPSGSMPSSPRPCSEITVRTGG